jgi:hypothetical protein
MEYHHKTMNSEKATFEGVKIKTEPLLAGDWVHVKSREEIEETLDRWKEYKGCAFLEYMSQYCGTKQRVLQPLERFLDERDYKVKKCRGVVLLENVICRGTPIFGRTCSRCQKLEIFKKSLFGFSTVLRGKLTNDPPFFLSEFNTLVLISSCEQPGNFPADGECI